MDQGAVRRLIDELDCRALLMRYGTAVDWRDRTALDAVFWPDAEVDLGLFKGTGAEAAGFLVQNAGRSRRRCHVTFNLDLRLEGDSARAHSCALTHAIAGAEAEGMSAHLFLGRYIDRLERRRGEWRIASRRYLLHGAMSDSYFDLPALAGMAIADDLDPSHPLFMGPAPYTHRVTSQERP